MANTGLYLYGLIRSSEDMDFGDIGLEQDGKPSRVQTLRLDSIAAVVSEYGARGKILPLCRNLEPHNRVIREVMKSITIVPMTFGHVAKGPEEITRLLRRNRGDIRAQLERVHGKVEMALKIKWGVDNIFEHMVSVDPELKAKRDELFADSGTPSQPELVELGRMFEQRLSQEREEQTERVLDQFRKYSGEVKVNSPKNEKVLKDLAFLVERGELAKFEEQVYQVANAFPAEFVFDYTGPWAPFNFVELDLNKVAA